MIDGKEPCSDSGTVSRQHLARVLDIDPDRFISRTKLCSKLDLDPRQLRAMEKSDDWPTGALIGRRVKYVGSDVLDWLVTHRYHA